MEAIIKPRYFEDGKVMIGYEVPNGFFFIMGFGDWDTFKSFADMLLDFYNIFHPRVPDYLIEAFKEDKND